MPILTGHYTAAFHLPGQVSRIVSLVPSQTELLADLGLEAQVVGITKFCVHPETWFHTKTRVGGTKNLHMQTIHGLKPDLVLANREENHREQIEELSRHYPVWVSEIGSFEDSIKMIQTIGELTCRADRASDLIDQIRRRFENFSKKRLISNTPLSGAYFIWKEPYMAAGGDTFISAMMTCCGLKNIFEDQPRYPQITLDILAKKDCRLLLLSSEPYPFREKHILEIQKQLPSAKIILVDGEMFSWYGSRLLYAPDYFEKFLLENGLAENKNGS